MASAAPLRSCVAPRLTPLIRVGALRTGRRSWAGWPSSAAPAVVRPRRPNRSLASTTMLRPSGVSSGSEASCARSARSSIRTRPSGRNSTAWRLPSVIVPVLSSSSVSTSPAASTARPLIAMTFCWISRSMPAMPMAESRPPIVVGMRQTSSATSTGTGTGAAAVDGERLEGHHGQQEHDREPREQDGERDLVGRLLTAGALHQRDHPVDEGLARVRGDPHDQPVGEQAESRRSPRSGRRPTRESPAPIRP